jgi:hypothetical protein
MLLFDEEEQKMVNSNKSNQSKTYPICLIEPIQIQKLLNEASKTKA